MANHDNDLYDDPVLTQSFKQLPVVEAPTQFLPNVMTQVYEYHHREKINMKMVVGVSLVLLAGCLTFFAMDISDFAARHDLDDFSSGLSHKIQLFTDQFDNLLSAFSGMLSVSWQMVSGLLAKAPVWVLVAVVLGVVLFILAVRRYITELGRG